MVLQEFLGRLTGDLGHESRDASLVYLTELRWPRLLDRLPT
jgi:hypothetical protein